MDLVDGSNADKVEAVESQVNNFESSSTVDFVFKPIVAPNSPK